MKPLLMILGLATGLAWPGLCQAVVETHASASTAAEFLAIPAGARPTALGEAFTGVIGDLNSIYWNPAGLTGLTSPRIMANHNSWIESINLEYLLYAQPVPDLGVVGASLAYVNFGAIERWTLDGSGNPVPTDETYTPFALAGTLAFGLPVGQGFSAGAGLKISYEQIDDSGSLAGALDLGITYRLDQDFSAGLVLRNIGINGDENLLPMGLRLGAAYVLPYSFTPADFMTALADVELKYDENPVVGAGLEYTYARVFQIRAGWNQNFGRTDDQRQGLTVGAGVYYGQWNLDYAFAPQGDLGVSHRVSLQYAWEAIQPPAVAPSSTAEPTEAPPAKEN